MSFLSRLREGVAGLLKSANLPATSGAVRADLGPGISGPSATYYGQYQVNSDGAKWRYGLSSTGHTPILDHTALRNNSRSAYHDSLEARAIIGRLADTVPGTGLRLEAQPRAELLGITPDAAAQWASRVNVAFDSWMSSKDFSLVGDQTGYQSQRFVLISQLRDGEYFARLTYTPRGRENPLQVSFLDPAQIQSSGYTDTAGLPLDDGGIVRDADGREVSYKILNYDYKAKEYQYIDYPRVSSAGKPLLLHGWQREYAGQLHGYPLLSHALQELENLGDFKLSHIKKAIIESAVSMFVKPSPDAPASNPMVDLLGSGAGPLDAPSEPGEESDATTFSLDYSELNEVNMRPGSVGVFNLQGGEDLKSFQATAPSDSFGEFTTAFFTSVAASVGESAEVVNMKFGQNYSASRAALLLCWQVVQIWRQELVSDYLSPLYEQWLDGEIAVGRISAPGWADPQLRRAWLAASWVGMPMPNIDPLKSAEADMAYVRLGAQTLDRVAREYNGSSGAANRAQLVRELAELPETPFGPRNQSTIQEAENA